MTASNHAKASTAETLAEMAHAPGEGFKAGKSRLAKPIPSDSICLRDTKLALIIPGSRIKEQEINSARRKVRSSKRWLDKKRMEQIRETTNWARLWILLSTLLASAGWILSALHQLNVTGYGIVFALAIIGWLGWKRRHANPFSKNPGRLWPRLSRRFRRPAPALFLLLLILAGLTGACYEPTPGDAAMYRVPRVWHWLAAGQWHWIHTFDIRMNIANCGFEWLTAPLMLFTHSDRGDYLINLVSYALLPGLIFSVFRQLGVAGRVAWWWMWILSAGFCYAFQAATQGNDSFATIYALAAVNFALRACRKGRAEDVWISLLAVALVTGSKQIYLPLALLWFIAVLPALPLAWRQPGRAIMVGVFSVLVSAIPMIALNLWHDGNWAGVPKHPGADWAEWKSIELQSPAWGVIGNAVVLPLQQFTPPFFFGFRVWNDLMNRFVASPWGQPFSSFEAFGHLGSYPTEMNAGLGFMICTLLPVSIIWVWRRGNTGAPRRPLAKDRQLFWLRLAPWGLLVLYMAKIGSFESARQLAPYYVFLLPIFLTMPGHDRLSRERWWRRFGLLGMGVTALLMVLSPMHPLWPSQTIFNHLTRKHPNSDLIGRLQSYYQAPAINYNDYNMFETNLPAAEPVIGYATTVMGMEPVFWRPFHRKVARLRPEDGRDDLELQGIRYVVVDVTFLRATHSSIEELMSHLDARLIERGEVPKGWKQMPEYIYLIRLNSPADLTAPHSQST